MIIREALPNDIPSLSKLARKTYSETFGEDLTSEQLKSILENTRSEQYFKSVIDKDTILVALVNNSIVGYIQLSNVRYSVKGIRITDQDQAIHSIYVDSGFQGKGVGRSLMDEAFSHPRIKKAENIFIDVYGENTRALNFYTGYGFKTVGKIDVKIDEKIIGFDLVLMKHAE